MAKAYSYNAWSDELLTHIYQDDGGAFGGNQYDQTVFDYFPDDAEVDDAIYFMDDEYFRNIRLFAGTPFAATSVTFTWEYYSEDASDWAALSNVVNANAMENANQQDVTWDIPEDWRYTTVNGITYRLAIRCRISAINTPTEGGAQSTQKVFAGDNKIIATGGTSGARLTIADIYAADVAGTWGVLKLRFSNLPRFVDYINYVFYFYECFAKIEVGDGGTQDYFDFPRRNTLYMAGAGNFFSFLKTDALFGDQYGEFSSFGIGLGGNDRGAVNFLDADCDVVAYNTTFSIFGHVNLSSVFALLADGTYTDCIFYKLASAKLGYLHFNANCTIVRGTLVGLILDIRGNAAFVGTLFQSCAPASFTDGMVLDALTLVPDGQVGNLAFEGTLNLVDCTGVIKCSFGVAGQTTNVKWRFDLKVIDGAFNPIVGATVVITDVDGGEIFNDVTDASGNITQQQITQLTYTTTVGGYQVVSFDDFTSKTPHTVTISKAGYAPRTIKYTMDRKREEIEMLSTVRMNPDLETMFA